MIRQQLLPSGLSMLNTQTAPPVLSPFQLSAYLALAFSCHSLLGLCHTLLSFGMTIQTCVTFFMLQMTDWPSSRLLAHVYPIIFIPLPQSFISIHYFILPMLQV